MNTKPPKSKITVNNSGGGQATEWDIPAKKGVGFLMIFGCFFGGIPLLMISAVTLLSIFGNGEKSEGSLWGIIGAVVFLSIFILIGGAVFYLGMKMRYTSYQVKLRHGGVSVVKKFLRKETTEKLEGGNVHGVGLYSNSSTNGKPDYGLLVKAREGVDIKLASGVKEDELRWLASEMLAGLAQQGGLPTEEEMEAAYFSSDAGGELEKGVKEFKKQGVSVSLLDGGGEEFVIEKRGSAIGKTMIFGGLFRMIFSSVFIWIGFFADNSDLIFGMVGMLVAVGAFVTFILGISKLGTSEKYTFKTDVIVKEKLRSGVSKSKTTIQKSSFKKVEVKSNGNSNGEERYSVKLIDKGSEKPLKIFSWVNHEVTELVEHKVKAWLKPAVAVVPEVASGESYGSAYGSSIAVEKTVKEIPAQPTVLPSDVPIYSSSMNFKDMKGGIWIFRIGLSLFLCVGLGLTIFGVLNIKTAKESESWPSEQGVILSSKISVNSGSDSTTYGADVTYRYKVKGNTYENDKVTASEVSTSNRGRAKKIVKRYRVGKKVAVYYDPDDPEESVLETGLTGASWFLPGMGLAFFIIPLIILICIEKARRQ